MKNAERNKPREMEIDRASNRDLDPAMGKILSEAIKCSSVGRRGQSALKNLMFGRVAGNLIQTSPIPVVVVP